MSLLLPVQREVDFEAADLVIGLVRPGKFTLFSDMTNCGSLCVCISISTPTLNHSVKHDMGEQYKT